MAELFIPDWPDPDEACLSAREGVNRIPFGITTRT